MLVPNRRSSRSKLRPESSIGDVLVEGESRPCPIPLRQACCTSKASSRIESAHQEPQWLFSITKLPKRMCLDTNIHTCTVRCFTAETLDCIVARSTRWHARSELPAFCPSDNIQGSQNPYTTVRGASSPSVFTPHDQH
ncbi:hypothetical protein BST61_g2456 [Cercospora zeina]